MPPHARAPGHLGRRSGRRCPWARCQMAPHSACRRSSSRCLARRRRQASGEQSSTRQIPRGCPRVRHWSRLRLRHSRTAGAAACAVPPPRSRQGTDSGEALLEAGLRRRTWSNDEFQHKLLSATGAIAGLHKRRPDLILMDASLPDVDGVEATRLLKSAAQFAAIPVIMARPT